MDVAGVGARRLTTVALGCGVFLAVALVVLIGPSIARGAAYKFMTIDPFGAGSVVVAGVNGRGDIVGNYGTSIQTPVQGFVRRHGTFTTVDFPGSATTDAAGINNRGQITGFYTDATGTHGFLLTRNKFKTFDVPGAYTTLAFGINDRDQISGYYLDATGTHGFVRTGHRFKTIDAPGAGRTTLLFGINDRGDVVGRGSGAFLLARGAFTPIQCGTEAIGLNNRDEVVGPAFVWAHGTCTPVTIPVPSLGVAPTGINDSGTIVGFYGDPVDELLYHGFELTPVSG